MPNTHTLQTFSVHTEMDSLRPLQLVTQLYGYSELQQTTIRTVDKYCVCGVIVCVLPERKKTELTTGSHNTEGQCSGGPEES